MASPIRLNATVSRLVDHAPGLRSIYLRTARPVPAFKAGQFLHLALDPYNPASHWPESRCFSIASPHDQTDSLLITISQVGPFTERLLRLNVGDEVWIKLPYGDFVVSLDQGGVAVLIAGGTGITPFVSLLDSAPTAAVPVRVLYGARSADLLIYRTTLERAAERWPDLSWRPFIEDGPLEHGATRGRVSAEAALAAASAAGDVSRALFYVSGPPGMLRSIQADLLATGVPPDRIRIDAWE